MRAVLQRVSGARVTVGERVTGQIDRGFLILLGVAPGDTPAHADTLAAKITKLRVFSDDAGKMNLNVHDAGGAILSVSQFTLYADTRRGNRPSFTGAAAPDHARALYAHFNGALRAHGLTVEEGEFGADMQVSLVNDGPVTLLLDTDAP
ncbi:D-aminoacyl-tRNA deacylase [Deinococcus maricopensis]|uniref:D-aminoacyl-tRNA deacylase n=1 Tax=Deinococcus maricopensis (strain DSM 21211 / LMG 22137 / NRRL B-23946 / LB-34) TaxID=709986 RepID=E8U9Y3_DEIML|nr:D-aminoacyl-tRNA deacylase [Deinococcus maricopensis]ADV67872.1 D-tyrosyl-tRNA(Tyr) deacylase [Deinococcus maricopensis DSM 21211]